MTRTKRLQKRLISLVLYVSYHPKLDPRLLLATILRGKDEQLVVAFGLVCSSFVTISRGTTHRHYFLPDGDTSVFSVQKGNCLAARTLCLSMYPWVFKTKPLFKVCASKTGSLYIYIYHLRTKLNLFFPA